MKQSATQAPAPAVAIVASARPALRVGILGSWKSRLPAPDASYSSLDFVAWSTAQALRRRGVGVTVACADARASTAGDVDLVGVRHGPDGWLRRLVPGVRPRWSSSRHHPWYLVRGVRALRLAGVQAVQVTHEFANLRLARRVLRGIPLVTLLHAVWVDDHRWLARRLLHADAVCAISDYVRDAVVAVEPRLEGRTFTVRNGVDLKVFAGRSALSPTDAAGAAAWRERLETRDRPLIVAIGRVTPEKGQHVLAQAAARLAARGERPVVALVGQVGGTYERPGRARNPFWRQIEALSTGYADRVRLAAATADVRLLGSLPPLEVKRLLAATDVFVSPSLSPEPFGLPVLEALAMELPVVASDNGATPEIVGTAGVLVPPGDAGALADALGELLGSSSRRAALAQRARSQASQHSWDATAAQMEAVFRRLV